MPWPQEGRFPDLRGFASGSAVRAMKASRAAPGEEPLGGGRVNDGGLDRVWNRFGFRLVENAGFVENQTEFNSLLYVGRVFDEFETYERVVLELFPHTGRKLIEPILDIQNRIHLFVVRHRGHLAEDGLSPFGIALKAIAKGTLGHFVYILGFLSGLFGDPVFLADARLDFFRDSH